MTVVDGNMHIFKTCSYFKTLDMISHCFVNRYFSFAYLGIIIIIILVNIIYLMLYILTHPSVRIINSQLYPAHIYIQSKVLNMF